MELEPIELKTVDSMSGSINEMIHKNKYLRRPPSLSESFAWTPENIQRANQVPLLTHSEKPIEEPQPTPNPSNCHKYEKPILTITIKLLLHITLISVFETLFFFFYVSTLEDNGIESTVNTFIDGAANSCKNLNPQEIQIVNSLLGPYINSSQIILTGNSEETVRLAYDKTILNRAWAYVGGFSGLFVIVLIYSKIRRIQIEWRKVVGENVAMVLILALYELMFFNTIIYPYKPITTEEIERNAIETLQNACGILN